MFSKNGEISEFQFICFVVLSFFGVNAVTLPYTMSMIGNEKGCFLVFFGTLAVVIYAVLIEKISDFLGNDSFYGFLSNMFNTVTAKLIIFGFVFKSIFLSAFSVSFLVSVIKTTLLKNTPEYLISFVILLCVIYLTSKDTENVARVYTILIILNFITFFTVLLLSLSGFDFSNLCFYGKIGGSRYLFGALYFLNMFNGIEGCLILLPKTICKKNKNPLSKAVFITSVLMLIIVLLCYGKFGFIDLKTKMYPLLNIMDSIDFPGAFIERQDILVMNFFIVSVFAYIGYNAFLAFKMMSQILPKKEKWFNLIYILIFIISAKTDVMLLLNNKVLMLLNIVFAFSFIVFPFILLIGMWFEKRGEEE